jgi:hypothetical protein
MTILRFFLPVSIALLFFGSNVFAEQLTSDYLEGPWCYSHTMSVNGRQDETKNFLFDNNGTFSYQQSKHNKKLTPGFKYTILPNTLKLKPIFPGTLKVKSVKQDEMVLFYFVDLYFIRGECS